MSPIDLPRDTALLASLLEAAPDAMLLVDAQGRIVLLNGEVERLFGYSRGDLVGRSVESLIPERFSGHHPAHRAAYTRDPKTRPMGAEVELFGRRKDGSEFPAEISLSPFRTQEGDFTTAAIRDVTGRRKAEAKRAHLAAIVDASDDAIIGKTLDGVVTSWNPGAERLFGYTAEEMIGHPISRLVPSDRQDEERRILAHLASGQVEHIETVRLRKDGTEIGVAVTSSPVRDSRGVLIGASKIARDITERQRAEEALAHAKVMAEAASRELEAFSYSVAHDLRAPLRGMSGFAHLLLEGHSEALDAEGRDWLQEIVLNAKKMGALIDALLSLSRVSRSELRRERVDLSSVARATAGQLATAEPGRAVELVVEDGLAAQLDPALAQVLVSNLLENAWKFTRGVAAARVEVGVAQKGGGPAFFVRDNGAGFDMAYVDKLFAPFQRLHAAAEFPGTGIGLATVQRIVHRHGGRVWAEGIVDGGATLYFAIPEPTTTTRGGP